MSDQRKELDRALQRCRLRWASAQGYGSCVKSAPLAQGSVSRYHESETASFHEADCLHPSETIACERRRADLETGWAAWLLRR